MTTLEQRFPWYGPHQKYINGENGGVRADLSRADLSGANLRWADLSRANLRGADLSRADLSRADLSGANLRWADLSRADLSGANLRWADLSRADLSGANLRWADLSRADLTGADLTGADLSGANLSGAKSSAGVISHVCSITASNHGECGRMLTGIRHIGDAPDLFWCGCFRGDEHDLRAYIKSGDREHEESRTMALNCCLSMLDLGSKPE